MSTNRTIEGGNTDGTQSPPKEPAPFVYRPEEVVEQYPALMEPARKLGLLESKVFDAGMPVNGLPFLIQGYFPGCKIELWSAEEARKPSNVVDLSAARAPETDKQTEISGNRVLRSGVSFEQEVPRIWVEERQGRVSGVDLLREVGVMVEWQTMRLLSVTKGASVEIGAGATTLVFRRENTPGVYLQKAGLIVRSSGHGAIDGNAAVIQALSFTILTGQDPRYVFLDIFERAQTDRQMLALLTVLANRSGVDWTDRKALTDYARLHYQLYDRALTYLINVQQVNDHASYFARHIQMNMRNPNA